MLLYKGVIALLLLFLLKVNKVYVKYRGLIISQFMLGIKFFIQKNLKSRKLLNFINFHLKPFVEALTKFKKFFIISFLHILLMNFSLII